MKGGYPPSAGTKMKASHAQRKLVLSKTWTEKETEMLIDSSDGGSAPSHPQKMSIDRENQASRH
jgi:hypothetical protein